MARKGSDIVGRVFNSWTVVELTPANVRNQRYAKCRCQCGAIHELPTYQVTSGRSKQCRQCRHAIHRRMEDGQRFGRWTVINAYADSLHARCRCQCGHEKLVLRTMLTNGRSTSCRCSRVGATYNKSTTEYNKYWRIFKNNAIHRGIEVDVTSDEAKSLYTRQGERCALSGLPIRLPSRFHGEDIKSTASLDRLDSYGNYTANNIQWLHKVVNIMKSTLPQLVFVAFCVAVARKWGHLVPQDQAELEEYCLSNAPEVLLRKRERVKTPIPS